MKMRGQGVVHVKNLFAKYAKILHAPQKTVVQAGINAIHDVCGYEVAPHQCVYKTQSRTLTISIPGIAKNEVLLRKKEILAHIVEALGAQSAPREIL